SSPRNSFHARKRSSEETRNPRSMKKLSVVCQAGPRSNNAPRPSPSRFHKNSFSPLDTRLDSHSSGARFAPTDATGEGPLLRGLPEAPIGRDTPRLPPTPAPTPMPSLLRKLISLPPIRSSQRTRRSWRL